MYLCSTRHGFNNHHTGNDNFGYMTSSSDSSHDATWCSFVIAEHSFSFLDGRQELFQFSIESQMLNYWETSVSNTARTLKYSLCVCTFEVGGCLCTHKLLVWFRFRHQLIKYAAISFAAVCVCVCVGRPHCVVVCLLLLTAAVLLDYAINTLAFLLSQWRQQLASYLLVPLTPSPTFTCSTFWQNNSASRWYK